MTHVGDTSHNGGFLYSWRELGYGGRRWRFWYKSEFPRPVAVPFPTAGPFLDVRSVGALCSPDIAISPVALLPDGRKVFFTNKIKPEKKTNSKDKQRGEVFLLKT